MRGKACWLRVEGGGSRVGRRGGYEDCCLRVGGGWREGGYKDCCLRVGGGGGLGGGMTTVFLGWEGGGGANTVV